MALYSDITVGNVNVRELVQLAALLLVGGFELLVFDPEPLLLQHDLLVQTGAEKKNNMNPSDPQSGTSSRKDFPPPEVEGLMSVLLLQVGDEFLLVVQLISQAADLLLMSFTVRVDLLLHRFLEAEKWNSIYISRQPIQFTVNQTPYIIYGCNLHTTVCT